MSENSVNTDRNLTTKKWHTSKNRIITKIHTLSNKNTHVIKQIALGVTSYNERKVYMFESDD